jgi:hypothetical protein
MSSQDGSWQTEIWRPQECAGIDENDPLFRGTGLAQRPYIERAWCAEVLAHPIRREEQADGRIRFWGIIRPRYLRVVTLADGETVHNAFFDRGFREDET